MNNGNLNDSPLIEGVSLKCKDESLIVKVVMNICLASTYCGYCLGYFNTINFDDTVQILQIAGDRAFMQGLLTFCVAVGAGFGAFYSKIVIENFSRRQSFLIIGAVSIAAALFLQTRILAIVFFCRLLQGITVGASTVIRATYIKEFVPIELAGKCGVINQVFFAIGLIFAFAFTYLLSYFMEAHTYWRIVYFGPIIFLSIQLYNLIFNFPFETPKYLLEKNKREKAKELATIIYKAQHVEQRIQELQKLLHIIRQPEWQEMQQRGLKDQGRELQTYLTSNKIAVKAAYHLLILQQIAGIQVIILYTGEIMLSINPGLQKLVPLILQIEGLIASLYAIRLIQKHGRKQLIQIGLVMMGITLAIISFSFFIQSNYSEPSILWNIIIIAGLFTCRGIFSLSIGPIAWLYLPEIVQARITGIATMLNWLAAAFVTFIYPILVELVGNPSLMFLIFTANVTVGYLLNEKWMIETKGKTEWQIRKEYDEKLKNES